MRKILSLILTICMLMTMVVATYTDAPAINHKEAVDVLSAIQVVNGYTDGSFKPEGNVTRAEMAKMICVLLNKGEDVGSLYSGAVTFSDCINHWAAGYIAYCAQEKIINGRNTYTFDPDANVTGTEAAKMLLCTLGYDPNVEGLVGANWAANTLSLARKCELKAESAGGSANLDTSFNLLKDMDNVSMTTPLNRENATQMIFNTMLSTKVDYNGNAQTITIGNTSFTTGATLMSLKKSIYDDYHALAGNKRLTRGAETGDDFGRPARVWTIGGEKIGSYSKAPTAIYNNAVTGGRVYTDLGKPQFGSAYEGKYSLNVIVDGVHQGDSLKSKIVSGNNEDITPNGSWTEIYVDDDTMTITMITAKYYIAQISGVYAAKTDFNNDVTREAYVTLKKVDTNLVPSGIVEFKDGTTAGQAFITDAYSVADRNVTYVVYTKANNLIQSLTRAEVKSGITGSLIKTIEGRPTTLILDSASYSVAATAASFSADYGTNATIYLDPNGCILYAEATASDAVAFVLAAGQEQDLYASKTTGANLLFTNGKTLKVNVYNANGNKYTDAQAKALAGTVVSYTVNVNGEYVLTPLKVAGSDFNFPYGYVNDIASVITNNPNLPSNTYTMFANDSTTFIVESSSKDSTGAITYSYTTYTGLKTVPTVEEKDPEAPVGKDFIIAGVNTHTTPTAAGYVFIVGGKTKDTSKASVSVFMRNGAIDSSATDANNNTYFVTRAVIDGEIKSVKMQQATYAALTAKPNFCTYTNMTTDTNGYVTSLIQAIDMPKYVKNFIGFNGDDGLYNNGVITMNGKDNVDGVTESFSVNANTPVYVFDTIVNTIQQTTVDAFSTTLAYKAAIVVLDSNERLLNNNEIVTAIYVSIG